MWLIVFCFLVGQILMINGIVFERRNGEDVTEMYLSSIDEVFYRTTVEPTILNIKYCIDNLNQNDHKVIDYTNTELDTIINKYTHLPNVMAISLNDTNNPATDYGVLYINRTLKLPLYIKADIRERHLHPDNTYPEFDKNVERQMILMGQLDTDVRGQLLAHSLGGISSALNIVPMARNVSQHYNNIKKTVAIKVPGSNFKSNEDWIRKFLFRYPNGRVTWTLACQYRHNIFTDRKRNQDYRPIRFAVEFIAYTNEFDISSVYLKRGTLSYLNNNDFGCEYKESPKRYKRSDDEEEIAKYIARITFPENGKCITMDDSLSNGLDDALGEGLGDALGDGLGDDLDDDLRAMVGPSAHFIAKLYYPDNGKCGLGVETVKRDSGDETPEDVAHGVVAGFSIGDKRYYYLLDITFWYIYELYPNGTISETLSQGEWKQPYRVILSYHANNRAFIYGCNNKTNDWVINELFFGGVMGETISSGTWEHKCHLTFPFEFDDKNYMYTQTDSGENNYWWIQELLPGGKMGNMTDSGNWELDSQLLIPFEINGINFFLRHNHAKKNWYSTELLHDGKMGKNLYEGTFHVRFAIAFPFVIMRDCKHYFLAHSIFDNTEWYIYELLPSGKVGNLACKGDFGQRCPTALRYEVQDKHYFYRRCMDTLQMYIQKLF